MNSYEHTSREFLPLSVIRSACAGDTDAVEQVLRHYRGYIFPKAFDTAAQDSYLEAQDTFSSLFEDTSKYKAIMSALAEWLYGEFRKK